MPLMKGAREGGQLRARLGDTTAARLSRQWGAAGPRDRAALGGISG